MKTTLLIYGASDDLGEVSFGEQTAEFDIFDRVLRAVVQDADGNKITLYIWHDGNRGWMNMAHLDINHSDDEPALSADLVMSETGYSYAWNIELDDGAKVEFSRGKFTGASHQLTGERPVGVLLGGKLTELESEEEA